MTTTPDPKTVNELALEVANIALHDAVHVDQWISAVVNSRFGNECSLFRAPLHTAVACRMAVARPSWPDEPLQDPQPWPRAQRMPLAIVGQRPQPWHHQALAEYGAATGTELTPNPTVPGGYVAAQINWAISWWNERVEAEQPRDGEPELARTFLTELREDIKSYHGPIPGEPGHCTCGRASGCDGAAEDLAAIAALEVALTAWAPSVKAGE